jgi:transcriptional regulator with XRE-family HTH domain
MVNMAPATNLKQLRESLGATQEQVARRTRTINLRTYLRAESGRASVKYDTAQQILEAMNGLLQDAGRDPVTLDDLGLTIY